MALTTNELINNESKTLIIDLNKNLVETLI